MFTHAKIDMTNPPMSANLSFEALTLLAGNNGVGKSFVNKLIWSCTFFQSLVQNSKLMGVTVLENKTDLEILQEVFDATFDDQNFQGRITLYSDGSFSSASELIFSIDDGVIQNLSNKFDGSPVEMVGLPTYLSSNVRSFGAIEKYLTIRNLMKVKIQSLEDALKLKDVFRLYDIFAYETLLAKFNKINEILKNPLTKEMLEGIDIESFEVTENSINILDSKGIRTKATSLGGGHQAILVMLLVTM